MQFSDFGLLPSDFFSCVGLLLHYQEPLFSFGQLISLLSQLRQLGLVCCFGRSRCSILVWLGLANVRVWELLSLVSKFDGFNSSSRDDEALLLELVVVLFFLVDILGFLLKPNTNGEHQLLCYSEA
jgi:hypothetical protein